MRSLRVVVPGEPRPWTVYTKRGEPPIGFQQMQVWQERVQAAVLGCRVFTELIIGPVRVDTFFYRSPPLSAPKRLEARQAWMDRHPCTTRPDLDNYRKACCDALIGVIIRDDNQVIAGDMSKGWALSEPRTVIEIQELE